MFVIFLPRHSSLRRVGKGAKRRAHRLPIVALDAGHAALCPPYRSSSLRAERSNPESGKKSGLLRRCAPRNDACQLGVKNGSGAPSVGLNTTFTSWPIFKAAKSQSTKLVCSDGPSVKVT